jgi:hypothetical protein
MSDFVHKAEDLAKQHPQQADQALRKGGEEVDKHTGDKYHNQVDKGVDEAEKFLGGQGQQGQQAGQNQQAGQTQQNA